MLSIWWSPTTLTFAANLWSSARPRWPSFLRKAKPGIRLSEHLTGPGHTIFEHACKLGLEGIVSKRLSSSYRSGKAKTGIKVKNPKAPAILRIVEGRMVKPPKAFLRRNLYTNGGAVNTTLEPMRAFEHHQVGRFGHYPALTGATSPVADGLLRKKHDQDFICGRFDCDPIGTDHSLGPMQWVGSQLQ